MIRRDGVWRQGRGRGWVGPNIKYLGERVKRVLAAREGWWRALAIFRFAKNRIAHSAIYLRVASRK